MIPKKIHYCWFGRAEKPALAQKCIAGWKKLCPDYEIIEWNEDNFDCLGNPYLEYCFKNKKWAFLSDLARLLIVEKHGGIYFDTDVELIANIDHLLENNAFYAFENQNHVATGLGFGAIAGHVSLKKMIAEYEKLAADENGVFPTINCPILNTKALAEFGLIENGKSQMLDDICILSSEIMNPLDDATGKLCKTENTISIHRYSKSWLSKKAVFRSKLTKPFHRIFGKNCFNWLKK